MNCPFLFGYGWPARAVSRTSVPTFEQAAAKVIAMHWPNWNKVPSVQSDSDNHGRLSHHI